MTYKEVIDFLFAQIPNYQKYGDVAYKPGLERVEALLEICGTPHHELKFIHVAGTNGKGSVCHLVASGLIESGMTVGLYSSPHLIDFRERIKVNGRMCSKDFVIDFHKAYKDRFKAVNPSFFEWTLAMALNYFRDQHVDWVVLETGLGGRLDATNVVNSEWAVITSVSKDHEKFLGSDLNGIAAEKAGIIKSGAKVVSGVSKQISGVIETKINEMNANLVPLKEAPCTSELMGSWQRDNESLAYTVLSGIGIADNIICDSFNKVIANTGLLGRWQLIRKSPTVITDVGHNEAAFELIMNELTLLEGNKIVVLGIMADKDVDGMLRTLNRDFQYIACSPDYARAMPSEELYSRMKDKGLNAINGGSVRLAYERALNLATEQDVVFVGGSNFVAADFLKKEKKYWEI